MILLKQKDIVEKAGISKSYISQLLSGIRRPSWKMAKRLASATSTPPILWMEGTPKQITEAINEANSRVGLLETGIGRVADNRPKPMKSQS